MKEPKHYDWGVGGYVLSIRDGISIVAGLRKVKAGEIVYLEKSDDFLYSSKFKGNSSPESQAECRRKKIERVAKFGERFAKALVLNLNFGYVGAMILGNDRLIAQGALAFRTGRLLKIKTSLAFFGHVLNSLGELIDDEDKGSFVRKWLTKQKKIQKIVFVRDRNNIRRIKVEGSDFVEKKGHGYY